MGQVGVRVWREDGLVGGRLGCFVAFHIITGNFRAGSTWAAHRSDGPGELRGGRAGNLALEGTRPGLLRFR